MVINWKVDTIAVQSAIVQSTLRIRGTSLNNLFIVGHNHRDAGILFRFNGNSWKAISTAQPGDVVSDLLPLSESNVIAAGYDAAGHSIISIWNGLAWSRQVLPQPDHRLTAVGGSPESGIWAGGYSRMLYRFDGTNWNQSAFDPLVHDSSQFYVHSIISIPGRNNFLLTHDRGYASSTWVTNSDKVSWRHFWSFGLSDYVHSLWPLSSNLALIGQPYGLFKAYDSGDSTNLETIDFPTPIWDLFGTSNSDLFAVGGSHLYHYDGSGWTTLTLPNASSMQLTSAWTDGSTIVILGTPVGISTELIAYRGSRLWFLQSQQIGK
jgi:hypothetical protein